MHVQAFQSLILPAFVYPRGNGGGGGGRGAKLSYELLGCKPLADATEV